MLEQFNQFGGSLFGGILFWRQLPATVPTERLSPQPFRQSIVATGGSIHDEVIRLLNP